MAIILLSKSNCGNNKKVLLMYGMLAVCQPLLSGR
jgi:hypothetical protein